MKISLPPDLLAQLPWPENEEATGKKIYLKFFSQSTLQLWGTYFEYKYSN